jgi:hypothetical protein
MGQHADAVAWACRVTVTTEHSCGGLVQGSGGVIEVEVEAGGAELSAQLVAPDAVAIEGNRRDPADVGWRVDAVLSEGDDRAGS